MALTRALREGIDGARFFGQPPACLPRSMPGESEMRLGAMIALPLTAALPVAAHAGATIDSQPRTAVISAFEPEWVALAAGIRHRREWRVNGVRFITGTIADRPVVLFLSGVSMVNAAMTTQLALDRFTVKRIVFSGVAGGVDPALDVGDVVVPERWGQYLEAVFARTQGTGYQPGGGLLDDPPIANYGMIYPRSVTVRRAGSERDEPRFWFDADPGLLAIARTVAAHTQLARCRAALCLTRQPKVVVGGNGISGPVFMDNAEYRAYAFATFKAAVTDMETAAVGQVAYANAVPFIAFRSLSDLAGGDPGHNQARAFFRLASDNSADVVTRFIAALDRPTAR